MAANEMNLRRIQSALADGKFQAKALLLVSPVNRFFATGFPSSAGMVLITPNDCRMMTDFRYFEAAQKALPHIRLEMMQRGHRYADLVNAALAELDVHELCYEDGETTVADYIALKESIHAELLPVGRQLAYLRAVKTEEELDAMRGAQAATDAAFEKILSDIHAGMTEKEIEARLIYHLYACGGEKLSFDPIVVSGPNGSLPHGHAGDRQVCRGDFITMDFGVIYKGYCSDMTRTVAVGSVSDEMREIYEIVLEAQSIGLREARAGRKWSEVDGAARSFIASKGYGEYFGHGLGHSLGLEVHESLNYSAETGDLTPENGVVSCEPGIYLPGRFGVRIEDCVILKKDGCENLAKSKKKLLIL